MSVQMSMSAEGESENFLCGNENTTCLLGKEPASCEEGALCYDFVTPLIFPFLAVCFGLILQPISTRLRVPYTSLLLVAGCLLGILGCPVYLSLLTDSMQYWVHISPPTLFFYIFLAPLVFESAFNADSHLFLKSFKQIVFMAFILVIAQIFLVAVFQLKVIQSPNWDLYSALVFGAMLSATDPISVSSTLKELGASEALNTVIEGESLLNDGSAVVFYEAFLEAAVSGEANAGR